MTAGGGVVEQEAGLRQGLGRAQIIMIGLGGAIGTGLFAGSSLAIGSAGPGVVLSYAIAGFIALVVVFSLSEMAVAHPAAGSFGVYAETYLNPLAGFVVRYTYWAAQVIATAGEAVASGVYMTWWFPGTPVWLWSLGFGVVILALNARSVGTFGSAEYAFSLVKVCAIVLFIILGAAKIFGLGSAPTGLTACWACGWR
jgi:L-asparagine transporter-like permease